MSHYSMLLTAASLVGCSTPLETSSQQQESTTAVPVHPPSALTETLVSEEVPPPPPPEEWPRLMVEISPLPQAPPTLLQRFQADLHRASSLAIVRFSPPKSYSVDEDPWILSDIDITVVRTVRGSPPTTITVQGGTVGGETVHVVDEPWTPTDREMLAIFVLFNQEQTLKLTAPFSLDEVTIPGPHKEVVKLTDLIGDEQ